MGELVGDPGVTEVVDGAVINAGELEVAVNGGADIADEELAAIFGDEEVVGFGVFGSDFQPFGNGILGGFVEGDFTAGLRFIRFDDQMVLFNVGEFEAGQFTDADAGLEEDLDNGRSTEIVAAGIA